MTISRRNRNGRPIPGSLQAIARLNHSGFHVVTATNQSGLARGKLTLRELNRIHKKMHAHLAQYGGVIEAVFFCPHDPDEGCACRKPKPGLLKEIERRLHTSLDGVPVIGDRLSDIQAAQPSAPGPSWSGPVKDKDNWMKALFRTTFPSMMIWRRRHRRCLPAVSLDDLHQVIPLLPGINRVHPHRRSHHVAIACSPLCHEVPSGSKLGQV